MIFKPFEIDRATTYLTKIFERNRNAKIEPVKHSKTISQVRYLWLIFTHIGFETGNLKEDIYQYCLQKFPFHKEIEINGEEDIIPVTLSGFSKEQSVQFIDQVTTFFRQEGYEVPDPEDLRCKEMFEFYHDKGLL
jgi:hypothetical protein